MTKQFFLSLLTLFIFQNSFAQNAIQGKVMDTLDNKSVTNASIVLIDAKDSTIVNFTRSQSDGSFKLNSPAGNYILLITHQSFADYIDEVSLEAAMKNMGTIAVTPKSKLLEEVIVKGVSAIRVKGDTTIYNADSFVVGPNANVQELLEKLPGLQVDKDGNIKAMGESVKKVLVDGEEFFGDDPGMAVKNLRADAVKEVQVFDQKSDQAIFTGIDDGNTQKTINLKLKEDKKKGYFGKVELSGGLQDKIPHRFNNNIMLNAFKGKRKISGYVMNGNTGQAGMNWEDREKYGANDDANFEMSEDGVMYSYSSTSDEELMVNTADGFTRNLNAGLQYTNKWNTHELNFSPKYNLQDHANNRYQYTQTIVGDSIINSNRNTQSLTNRYNFRQNLVYKWKIDTNKTLIVRANGTYSFSESEEHYDMLSTGGNEVLKNRTNSIKQYENEKLSFSTNITYQQKFRKPRRTLSAAFKLNSYKRDLRNKLIADNISYFDGVQASNVEQNQFTTGDNNNSVISGNLIYTEPLTKKFSLITGYQLTVNSSRNDQITYQYSSITGKYDNLLDSLTNDFEQILTEHRPSLKISYNTKKLTYNFGASVALVDFDLNNNSQNQHLKRNYTNFFPEAMLSYKYKSNSNLRFSYNGSTTQPSVHQLQPLNNNTNYFYQYIGNPDLKPTFRHQLSLTHNSYNFLKERWLYQSISFTIQDDAITNNTRIDLDSNKRIVRPENTDGNFFINGWFGGGTKLSKLKASIDFSPNFNYFRNVQIINDEKIYSNQLTAGLNIGIRKEKSRKYETYLSNNIGYSRRTLSSDSNKDYFFTNSVTASAKVYYKKVWSLSTNYNYQWRQKTRQFNEDVNIHLWEARLEKTFRKDEFTAFVHIRDILNQNIEIQRSFSTNTVNEIRNERLMQYWMVGFIWNFKNK